MKRRNLAFFPTLAALLVLVACGGAVAGVAPVPLVNL